MSTLCANIREEQKGKIVEQVNQKMLEGYQYLYDNYYPSLCSFSSHFFKQQANAEDIVQEVFFKLWKSNSKFTSIEAIKAYLYLSVKNASLNAIRNNSKLSNTDILENSDAMELKINDKSVEQLIIEEEFYRRIYKAIEKLSPKRKEIILLSMDGLSNNEIAEKLQISVNTVKTLKLKAYSILRKELDWAVLFFLFYTTK